MTENPVAIVTAAGRGIGAAIARELAARGHRLVLMSPSGSAETLAAELGGIGLRGVAERAEDLQALADTARDRFGRIDAVVTISGRPPAGDLLDITDAEWSRGAEMLLLPVVRMARLATPSMLAAGRGAFLNITSFATFEPMLAVPVACTIRAGIAAFTKLYADRYAASGIRMNALLPGYLDNMQPKPATLARIPMQRFGTMAEIARTAAFLLSDDAGYITGQNIRADGGITHHI